MNSPDFTMTPGNRMHIERCTSGSAREHANPRLQGLTGGPLFAVLTLHAPPHISDVARATVAAISQGDPGLYNVDDNEPAPVSTWLPALAEAVGAKPAHGAPVLAWQARHRRWRRVDDDEDSRRLERQGEARARLAAEVPKLAAWFRRRARLVACAAPHSLAP